MDVTFVHGTLDPASDPRGHAAIRGNGPCAVAIGKFDGIHRGHLSLLSRLLVEARRRRCQAGVVTFDASAAEVLLGARPVRLTTLPERKALCAEAGVEFMLALRSTPALFATEADEFAATLIGALDARVIVVGSDFRFGRSARGDVDTLRSVASRFGAEVIGVALEERSGLRVTSTRIREELGRGSVEAAAELLGRPYSMAGTVSQSTARSLSIQVGKGMVMPAPGVYLGRIAFEAARFPGGTVITEVDDGLDGQPRLRLLNLQRRPFDIATAGQACTVTFDRSAATGSAFAGCEASRPGAVGQHLSQEPGKASRAPQGTSLPESITGARRS